jgi:hypothetical protein
MTPTHTPKNPQDAKTPPFKDSKDPHPNMADPNQLNMNGLNLNESQHAPHSQPNGFERGAYIPPHLRRQDAPPVPGPPIVHSEPPPHMHAADGMINGGGYPRTNGYVNFLFGIEYKEWR